MKDFKKTFNRYVILIFVWGLINLAYMIFMIIKFGLIYKNVMTAFTCAGVSFIIAYLLRSLNKGYEKRDRNN